VTAVGGADDFLLRAGALIDLARTWNDRFSMSEDAGYLDQWGMGPVHGATSAGRGWWQGEALTAADVMTATVTTVPRNLPIMEVAELMRRESIGMVPVVDAADCLVGIITDRDIVVRGCVSERPLAEQTAAQVMTTDVEFAWADDSLVRVVERMARRGVRRLPVLDRRQRRSQQLIGVVSFEEAATHALDEPELAEALERLAEQRRHATRNPSGPLGHRTWFLPALWRRLRG
jgi:CBS domain-containing protein